MAINTADWQFRADKTIRYIGPVHGAASASYASVLEIHRLAQDLADDPAVTNDDFLDITVVSPSDKKFDTIITLTNGWTLDDAHTEKASEHIYGGSIIQGTGGTEAIYDGISVVANRGVIVNVIQNNTIVTPKFWNTTPNGESFAGINADSANGVAMRFMVKVKNAGNFIDNGALIFTTREWGKTFSEFRIPSTGRGVNVVPLTYVDDLNNTGVVGTVATWTTIANLTEGYNTIDLQQGDGAQGYYSKWDRNTGTTYSINQFYERMKWLTRNGATTDDLYGLDGELFRGITHSVAYTSQAGGNFTTAGVTPLSWGAGATAGTGQILGDNDAGTTGTLYIQLLTGVSPTSTITQGAVTATAGTVTERAVSAPFCGQSTGSAIVGAYGFALEYADLSTNDKLTALDGTTRSPPNNVTFTVNGIQSGWRILVGPEDGAGGLNYNQLTTNATLTGAAVTSLIFTEAAPANTPSTGTVRVHRADGSWTRIAYSAYNAGTKTFTITSTNFSTNNGHTDQKFFISYIDADSVATNISYNTVQTATQTLYIEARYGGTGPLYINSIKPAKTTGSLGTTGGSATVSAVSDA